MMMKKIILLTIICLLIAPDLVLAQGKEQCGTDGGTWLAVPIFGTSYENRCIENPAEYVQKGYSFGIALVGIVAVIMIMIGGYQYMISAGNASQMSNAKDRIKDAILGLILALLSYLILSVLNPDLVNLKWNNEGLLGDVVQKAQEDIEKEENSCNANNTTIPGTGITVTESSLPLGVWIQVDIANNEIKLLDDMPTETDFTQNVNMEKTDVFKVYRNVDSKVCQYETYENVVKVDCEATGCSQDFCVGASCKVDIKNTPGTCQFNKPPNVNQESLECLPN